MQYLHHSSNKSKYSSDKSKWVYVCVMLDFSIIILAYNNLQLVELLINYICLYKVVDVTIISYIID